MNEMIMLGGVGIAYVASMVRICNSSKRYKAVMKAILEYQKDCCRNCEESYVSLSDMQSFLKTFIRIWDWGYTDILPREKFELIKPYIK